MTSIRTFASPQIATLSGDAHRRAQGQGLALAVALLVAVLIVEAVAIATVIPAVPEIGWLYASTT
jgi:hypothetical protein